MLVYIDDIIIYSSSLDDQIRHIDDLLRLLKDSEVTLALFKCYFAYPSIQALRHHVFRLGLSTTEEKVEVNRKMKFPESFFPHALQQHELGI